MKTPSRIFRIPILLLLSILCFCTQAQAYKIQRIAFNQYINLFKPLVYQDSLLHLYEIGFSGYYETILDSTYFDFYNRTKEHEGGLFACNPIPSYNSIYHGLVPFFRQYATFRIDCSNGYLVCICHRCNLDNLELSFLEFDSYDTNGFMHSRLTLPYLVNLSEQNHGFLAVSTLLYVSNSKLYYCTHAYSDSSDYGDARKILYHINSDGRLIFEKESRFKVSGGLDKLGGRPPENLAIE